MFKRSFHYNQLVNFSDHRGKCWEERSIFNLWGKWQHAVFNNQLQSSTSGTSGLQSPTRFLLFLLLLFFWFFFKTVKRKKWQEVILFKKRKGIKKRRLRLEASTGHHGELPSTWKKSHSANVNKDKSSWLQLKTGLGVIKSQYIFKACTVQAACPQVK